MADDSLQQRLETGVGFHEPPIRQIVRPFQEFFQIEASSGIVLIAVTVIALIWANSPWAERYFQLWETEAGIVFGQFHLEMHLSHWINDGLMAIFFFLVGLEIKREILVGELSTPKKALAADCRGDRRDDFPRCHLSGHQRGHGGSGRLGHPHGDRHRLCPGCAGAARQPRADLAQDLPGGPGDRGRSGCGAGDRGLLHRAGRLFLAVRRRDHLWIDAGAQPAGRAPADPLRLVGYRVMVRLPPVGRARNHCRRARGPGHSGHVTPRHRPIRLLGAVRRSTNSTYHGA